MPLFNSNVVNKVVSSLQSHDIIIKACEEKKAVKKSVFIYSVCNYLIWTELIWASLTNF